MEAIGVVGIAGNSGGGTGVETPKTRPQLHRLTLTPPLVLPHRPPSTTTTVPQHQSRLVLLTLTMPPGVRFTVKD